MAAWGMRQSEAMKEGLITAAHYYLQQNTEEMDLLGSPDATGRTTEK